MFCTKFNVKQEMCNELKNKIQTKTILPRFLLFYDKLLTMNSVTLKWVFNPL